jgi:hypothetical protein
MSALTRVRSDHTVATSIARRAVDLASDPGVSVTEATDHLIRLAKMRPSELEHALIDVGRWCGTSAECEHARLLLRDAIVELGGNAPSC